VTDGTMEAAGITNWPHTDVTATSSSVKATDQAASGQSLKGTSATGKGTNVQWFNAQSVGTITGGSTVTLSLWWAAKANGAFNAASGTLYVESSVNGTTWTTLWSNVLTIGSLNVQSGTVTPIDVSASFATTASYQLRLRFAGKTANTAGSSLNVWWDDVVLDVAAPNVVTVGDGSNPSSAGLCPSASAAMIDAFTLVASTTSASVTQVTVSLAAGTSSAVSLVEVTSDDGSVVYGSAVPAGDSVPVTVAMTATTSSTQYKIRITPKAHAALPIPPGSNYLVSAVVSAITTPAQPTISDGGSATLTIDNTSPIDAVWGAITPSSGQIALNWTRPGDAVDVVILRNTAAIVDRPTEGVVYAQNDTIGAATVRYAGTGLTFTDTGLLNGTDYYYSIFSRDACGNYAQGAATGPHQPVGASNGVVAGSGSATVNSCTRITVSATHTGDADGDSTTRFERGPSASGPWSSIAIGCDAVGGSSPRSCIDNGVAESSTYYYQITWIDADGVTGVSPQTVGPYSTPSCTMNNTSTGTVLVSATSCSQLQVTAPFTGDADVDGTVRVEYNTANSWPGTVACDLLAGASPRICTIDSLTASTTYYVRATFTDGDGVSGVNPQVAGPVATPACAALPTTRGSATVAVSSCTQLTVSAPFTGDDNGNGSLEVQYNAADSWPGTVACSAVGGASPRQCLVTGLSPANSYYIRTAFVDSDGVSGANPQVSGPHLLPGCGADSSAPTLTILSPWRNAVIGGLERVKVSVFDAGGLALTNPVAWWIDNGTPSTVVSVNASYSCGDACSVYEFQFDTLALANGAHSIGVQAADLAGNVARLSWGVRVNNGGGRALGDGRLLRRTPGSQLCLDCHALQSHSSQSTSTKYGNWSIDCATCHTPHKTTNIYLIREHLLTLNSGTKTIVFRQDDRSGGTNPNLSFLGEHGTGVYDDGICESCHTKTTHFRNDLSGGDHTHNQTVRCVDCHTHAKGFAGAGCNGCHHAPPAVGKHRTKHDEVWDSTTGKTASSYDDGSSHATPTQYGFACSKCHTGTHTNDQTVNPSHDGSLAAPWLVEIVFNGANTTSPFAGSYSGTYNASNEAGPGGDYFSWSNGGCSNLYCHSNANPLGGTNAVAAVTWDQAATTTCVSCHKTGGFGDTSTDATFLSKSHATHIASTLGETGTYTFGCDACHAATIRNAPNAPWNLATIDLADKRLHVNEFKDVAFSTTLLSTAIDQSAGIYAGTRTCSGTYCHSQGTSTASFVAPNDDLVWGTTASCASCHSGAAGATVVMGSAKHTNHVDNATLLGVAFTCETCHSSTVTGNTTISTIANHVDGLREVTGTNAGTWNGTTCADGNCHSSGQRSVTPEYYSVTWATDALGCAGCHGRHSTNAFTPVAGEPNYTNGGAAATTANSHRAHVGAATDCAKCHAATVATSAKIDGTTPARHLDFDGTPDVVFASVYTGATYNAGAKSCAGVSCHGAGTPVWGGNPLVCLNCHGATNDADDWNIANNLASAISTSEWTNYGHGKASIALPGTNPCLYCHTSATGHGVSTNPFRLANYDVTGDGWNSVCLVCHKSTASGYDPGSGLKPATTKIDAYHYGTDHGATNDGGRVCWDCHDGHGDDSNIKMIGRDLIRDANDVYGLSATRTAVAAVFTSNATGAGYAKTASPFNGVCNVCHSDTGPAGCENGNHYTSTCGDSHGLTQVCTQCHGHDQPPASAFKPVGGGNCLGCHGDGSGAPSRRPVGNDFSKNSHHVGSGSTSMGGTLTNFDCVVCHAEGKVIAGPDTDTTGQPHMDGKIDLRDADSSAAYFTYDKSVITGAAGNWMSGNTNWETQNAVLDQFCLTCHDYNGATATFSSGGDALNPFADGAITNDYDQVNRGRVVDVASRVAAAWRVGPSGSSYTSQDRDQTGEPRGPDTRPDPPLGIYSRHAIRGLSVSVYGTNALPANRYATRPSGAWDDAAVMGCADCHTTDGANTTNGNAHGSNTEYLLKDADGLATTEPAFDIRSPGTSKITCYKCHNNAWYAVIRDQEHTGSTSDFVDTTGSTGTARNTGNGNIFGLACTNCHGGVGFGSIHGTSDTFTINSGPSTRQAYRFTNGASLRYVDPQGWTGSTFTCYTLGSADSWGSCTQHPAGGSGKPMTKTFTRAIKY
jgi:predicted CxxxxCH...CXXCH cytochrome family protein